MAYSLNNDGNVLEVFLGEFDDAIFRLSTPFPQRLQSPDALIILILGRKSEERE